MWQAVRAVVVDRAFVIAALDDDKRIFVLLVMFVPAVLLLASFVEIMLPKSVVERWLGAGSGVKGIMVSSLAGMFTPGGPFLAFPLVLALYRAGADWAPLIAYITAWSMNSVTRLLVFEIPFVGVELPMVRLIACFALPPLAGLTARWISRVYKPAAGGPPG